MYAVNQSPKWFNNNWYSIIHAEVSVSTIIHYNSNTMKKCFYLKSSSIALRSPEVSAMKITCQEKRWPSKRPWISTTAGWKWFLLCLDVWKERSFTHTLPSSHKLLLYPCVKRQAVTVRSTDSNLGFYCTKLCWDTSAHINNYITSTVYLGKVFMLNGKMT